EQARRGLPREPCTGGTQPRGARPGEGPRAERARARGATPRRRGARRPHDHASQPCRRGRSMSLESVLSRIATLQSMVAPPAAAPAVAAAPAPSAQTAAPAFATQLSRAAAAPASASVPPSGGGRYQTEIEPA